MYNYRAVFICLLSLFLVSCSDNNLKETYYESGKLKSKAPFVKGQLHGEAIFYHENGKISMKVNYNNGKVYSIKKVT